MWGVVAYTLINKVRNFLKTLHKIYGPYIYSQENTVKKFVSSLFLNIFAVYYYTITQIVCLTSFK